MDFIKSSLSRTLTTTSSNQKYAGKVIQSYHLADAKNPLLYVNSINLSLDKRQFGLALKYFLEYNEEKKPVLLNGKTMLEITGMDTSERPPIKDVESNQSPMGIFQDFLPVSPETLSSNQPPLSSNSSQGPKYIMDKPTISHLTSAFKHQTLQLLKICDHCLKFESMDLFTIAFGNMIKSMSESHGTEYTIRYLKKLPVEFVTENREVLSEVITRLVTLGALEEALNFYKGSKFKKLNRSVYLTFIHHYTSDSHLSFTDTLVWYNRLIAMKYKPTNSTLTRIMLTLSKTPQENLSATLTHFYDEYDRTGIAMDPKSFNAYLRAHLKINDTTLFLTAIKQMKEKQIPIDLDICYTMLAHHIKSKQYNLIPEVLDLVEELEPVVDGWLSVPDISKIDQFEKRSANVSPVVEKIIKLLMKKMVVTNDLVFVLYYMKLLKRLGFDIDQTFMENLLVGVQTTADPLLLLDIFTESSVLSKEALMGGNIEVCNLWVVMKSMVEAPTSPKQYSTQMYNLSRILVSHSRRGDFYASLVLWTRLCNELGRVERETNFVFFERFVNISVCGFLHVLGQSLANTRNVEWKTYWIKYVEEFFNHRVGDSSCLVFDLKTLKLVYEFYTRQGRGDLYFNFLSKLLSRVESQDNRSKDRVRKHLMGIIKDGVKHKEVKMLKALDEQLMVIEEEVEDSKDVIDIIGAARFRIKIALP